MLMLHIVESMLVAFGVNMWWAYAGSLRDLNLSAVTAVSPRGRQTQI